MMPLTLAKMLTNPMPVCLGKATQAEAPPTDGGCTHSTAVRNQVSATLVQPVDKLLGLASPLSLPLVTQETQIPFPLQSAPLLGALLPLLSALTSVPHSGPDMTRACLCPQVTPW